MPALKRRTDQGDLYHRPRQSSKDDAAWRTRFVLRIKRDRDLFPLVPPAADVPATRELVDDGVAYLREVSRILCVLHGTPDLGNKSNPVDELVYILLSRKTNEKAYQLAFGLLRSRFSSWDELLKARPSSVQRLVSATGLETKKTASIIQGLTRLRDEFGSCTLEPTREWTDARLAEFLCSIPGVQRKSAYCVMMYAMGRKVFPVDTHVGRVLTRLGPYRELGLCLDGLDHKQLQGLLDDLIPPDLRYSLHVNLVVHGREFCQRQRPCCESCALRGFCRFYRRRVAMQLSTREAPRFADLFAGAGGLSTGLTRAGFIPVFAVEKDPLSARTYWLNHLQLPDSHLVVRDMRGVTNKELRRLAGGVRVDVLAAAPPCQGYSGAGFRSKMTLLGYRPETDDRNYLFQEVIRAARVLSPPIVLIENVPGMQSARKKETSFLEMAAARLRAIGYETETWQLNSAAFGVPQLRQRFFLVASRTGFMPVRPVGEYRDECARHHDDFALPPVTIEEAIFDLPPLSAGSGDMVTPRPAPAAEDRRRRRYLAKFGLLTSPMLIYNHRSRYNNKSDLELYATLRPGEDSIHAIERHGRDDLMRYRRDVFDDKYARLRGDRPSRTIVSHLARDGNGYIHPSQVRSITVREAARLQSFDDGFIFCGSPSDQWIQVGNAVPPLVGEAIGMSILDALRRK